MSDVWVMTDGNQNAIKYSSLVSGSSRILLAIASVCTTSLLGYSPGTNSFSSSHLSFHYTHPEPTFHTFVGLEAFQKANSPRGVVTLSCPVWKSGSPEFLE